MKRTPLKSKPEKVAAWLRKSRLAGALRKRGRKYKEKRERDFGVKARWVTGLPCVVCGICQCDPHHEPPRSLGGTAKDLVPLCREHHTAGNHSRHQLGSTWTFLYIHNIDLIAEAKRIHQLWLDSRGEAA